MRTKLLMLSTAALMAGTLLAAGQTIQGAGSAQEKEKAAPQGQINKGQPAKEQGEKAAPGRPQANETTRDQGKSQGSAQKGKEPQTTTGQATGRDEKGDTKGQVQREPSKQQPQGNTENKAQTQQRERTEGQAQTPQRDQGRTQQQGQREDQRGNAGASVSFTSEQKTKIRDTVFKGSNAPRVGKVDFAVRAGTVVPKTVRIVEIPEVIVDIHPEWRGYKYFIVNEELVIVEPDTLRIVAVIAV